MTAKVSRHRLPLQQLKLTYNQNKGRNYTEEEDRFLLVTLEKLGYGSEDVYERIRQEIKHSPMFRFDWFIKSRTALEINRRCNTLVSIVTKEAGDEEKEDNKKRKRVAGATAAAAGGEEKEKSGKRTKK